MSVCRRSYSSRVPVAPQHGIVGGAAAENGDVEGTA